MDEVHEPDIETEVQTGSPLTLQPMVSERHPFLQILTGQDAGRLVALRGSSLTIGRGKDADVLVPDTAVSRVHARLESGQSRTARIVDLGSRNGTWVRGERVESGDVADGERFSLGGRVVIKLAWYDAEEAALMARLYERSVRDVESGLLNRPYFLERAAALFARAHRQHDEVAVAVIRPARIEHASQWRTFADALATCPGALIGQWDEAHLAVVSPRGRAALASALGRLPEAASCGAAESAVGSGVDALFATAAAALAAHAGDGVAWAPSPSSAAASAPRRASRAEAKLEICSLGRGTVRTEGSVVADESFKTQKARWLLGHLAMAGAQGVSEDDLVECYWPDAGLGGRKSLNTAMSTLRKALGPRCATALHRGGGFVRLRQDVSLWYDVDAFEGLLSQAAAQRKAGDTVAATRLLAEAAALYEGPFLAGCYLDWALRRRELYERKMTDALCELAAASLETGEAESALVHASRAAEIDPYQQDAHQLVMRAHARLGRPDRSIRHYERVSRLLLDELGVEPSIGLVEECLRARLGLDIGATL